MFMKSPKLLGLAVLVTVGLLFATTNGASAAMSPVTLSSELLLLSGTDGLVNKVDSRPLRRYRQRRDGRRYNYRRDGRRYNYRRDGRRYRHRRSGYRYRYNGWWYSAPWFQIPSVAPAPRYGRRSHVNWCLNRYRSYNPRTNRFLGYDGRYHRCRSPYRR